MSEALKNAVLGTLLKVWMANRMVQVFAFHVYTEVIMESEKELLWEKWVLGNHSPQMLVYTMIFMAGL